MSWPDAANLGKARGEEGSASEGGACVQSVPSKILSGVDHLLSGGFATARFVSDVSPGLCVVPLNFVSRSYVEETQTGDSEVAVPG